MPETRALFPRGRPSYPKENRPQRGLEANNKNILLDILRRLADRSEISSPSQPCEDLSKDSF
jgi:hypothetical protein